MHLKLQKTIVLLISVFLLVLIMPNYTLASNYDHDYNFYSQYSFYRARSDNRVYISVPPSLFDYYHSQAHSITVDSDFAKFVTPEAVKPIAQSIQNVTSGAPNSDEDFANAVLMLVHQIPYMVGNVGYPVETLVTNSGDCLTTSLLAASIMKAGGLDVILLYYKDLEHVNLGVSLPNAPHNRGLESAIYYEYKGQKYWVAECQEIAVVTQDKTLDETISVLQEAVKLHLEGEDLAEMGLN